MGPSRQRAGSRRFSRPARALIGLGLAVAGVASIGTQAQAGSKPVRSAPVHPTAPAPAGFASWKQVWAYQARLNAAAETILAAGDAGNASIVADPTRRELRVYWHGAVPATVRTTAGLLGVPVTFRAAAFTHRELVIDAKRLAEAGRVVSAAPATNGSGLAVTVDGAMGPAAQSRLRTRSSVPLFITPGTRPTASSTALLNYPGTIDSRIYTGPFDASTVTNAKIAGATPDFVGNFIVTGGASSGEHFSVQVTKTDDFTNVGGVSCDPAGPRPRPSPRTRRARRQRETAAARCTRISRTAPCSRAEPLPAGTRGPPPARA